MPIVETLTSNDLLEASPQQEAATALVVVMHLVRASTSLLVVRPTPFHSPSPAPEADVQKDVATQEAFRPRTHHLLIEKHH